MGKNSSVIIIGDTHEPFCRKGYMDFCRKTQDKYKCETVVHIGDLVDMHSLSKHVKDPTGLSAGYEHDAAYAKLQTWFKAFPNVKVCIGNHDARIFKRIMEIGVPDGYIKGFKEMFDAPKGWTWEYQYVINNIRFFHGTGKTGKFPHATWASEHRMSTVTGHCHTVAGVEWSVCERDRIFGMTVGSGMDTGSYAAAYASELAKKPIISCGVILDNGERPFIEMMKLH